MNRRRPAVYDMSMQMGNGFRPYGFTTGELVKIDDESELYIVIQEYFDNIIMAPRLQVITTNGKVGTYPLSWFREVDEDVPSKR